MSQNNPMTFPPGPATDIVGGHLLSLRNDPLTFTTNNMRQYGGIVHLKLAKYDGYQVTDPDLLQQILTTDSRIWHKSIVYKGILADYLGNGLLVSDGDFWRRQRKLMQPTFHTKRISAYAQTMVDYTQRMFDGWQAGKVLDIDAEMMRLTLFIVGKTLFDTDLKDDSAKIATALGKMLHDIMDEAGSLVNLPDWIPTPLRFRKQRTIQMLEDVIMPIIEEHRATKEDRGDLLSMLLMAQDDDGSGMSDEQVKHEALTIVLAGHETTANTLTWTLYLLSQYPKIEAKLQQEVDTVLQGRIPMLEDLKRLPYTEMVLKEAMRLYPPAWSVSRQTQEATELGGYPIRRKSMVVISIYAAHRNEAYFPNAEVFDPERFTPENEAKLHKYAYLPFGGGPRICIGNAFAMMEAQLILASIVQRYCLSLLAGHPVELDPQLTLRPKHGMKMQLYQRETK
jgi:cytochrome P450